MSDKQTVKFGDICREVKLSTKDPIGDGYERYIGLEHLDSGSLKIKRWGMIAEDNPSFTRVFKQGDILIGKRRPYLKKAAIAEFDGVCSGDIIVVHNTDKLHTAELLPYFIQSKRFWDWAIKTSSGSLSPRTKFKSLAELPVELPCKSEQSKLLSKLNAAQNIFSLASSSSEALDNLYNSSISDALKKIIESKETCLLTLPELVTNNANALTAGPFGTIFKAKDFREEGVPIIQLRHVTPEGYKPENKMTYMDIEVFEAVHQPYKVKMGDLLITKLGDPPGISCIYDQSETAMVTPDVVKASINEELVNPIYLVALYNSRYMRSRLSEITKGGTRPRVTLNEFYKLNLPIPSKETQNIIAKMYNSMMAVNTELNIKVHHIENLKSMILFEQGG